MPVSPAAAVATLAAREKARADRLGAERAAIRARLPEAARLLREQGGATEVWLFGSHAQGRPHEASDIDLAADRVDPRTYLDVLVALEDLLGCDIDLVDLSAALPSLRQRVFTQGIRL